MEAGFRVVAQVNLSISNPDTGYQKVNSDGLQYFLVTHPNLDTERYQAGEGLTIHGVETVTKVLIEAVSANIHYAHQRGLKDSAAHLREVIAQLEKLFIETPDIKTKVIKQPK